MPTGFTNCIKGGGKVRTIAVEGQKGKYVKVCVLDGKSYRGEAHAKKASELKLKGLFPLIKVSKKFGETNKIEVMHAGIWEHPQYGQVKISEGDIDKFIQNFNNGTRKVDIAVDQEHMPEKGAAGWFKTLEKVAEGGKVKLKAAVEWTKLGQQLIKDGIFKYFSPEFDFNYEDQETHEEFENVLLGGALTNRPYFKSLASVALSENMYAGVTSIKIKGGERKMLTKKKLMAMLAKNPSFTLSEKASGKQVKLFFEAKEALAKKSEKTKKFGDRKKFISKAAHTKEMNEMKARLGVAEKKLQFKEIKEEVKGFVYSESNSNGVLLPKNSKKATKLLMAASPKVRKLFREFLEGLPSVSSKLFEEVGSGKGAKSKKDVNSMATAMVKKGKANTFREAVDMLQDSNPELFKE